MRIHGMGIVFCGGRGIADLSESLEAGWRAPGIGELPFLAGREMPAYDVPADAVVDRTCLKGMRRADRFSRMAALAAWDAAHDEGASLGDLHRVGIIVATALGPHVTTFKFLDDIIEYGDRGVSPTTFSHSVHNASASYISKIMDIRGPAVTLTLLDAPFHHALLVAQSWLAQDRCDQVLLGTVDELGTVMKHACHRKLRLAEDGRIRPFDFAESPAAVPGEGSVFFLLSAEHGPSGYGEISDIALSAPSEEDDRPDMVIIEGDGMTGDESPYLNEADLGVPLAGYTPIFGSMLSGSSFAVATAALTLRNEQVRRPPVAENPHGVQLAEETMPPPRIIRCVRHGCTGARMAISVQRSG